MEVASTGDTVLTPAWQYDQLLLDARAEANRTVDRMRSIQTSGHGSSKLDWFAETVINVLEPMIQSGVSDAARQLPQAQYLPPSLRTYYSAMLRDASAATKAMRLAGAVIGFGTEINDFVHDVIGAQKRRTLAFEIDNLVDRFASTMAGKGAVILFGSFLAGGPAGVAAAVVLAFVPTDRIFGDALLYTRDCSAPKLLGLPDSCDSYRSNSDAVDGKTAIQAEREVSLQSSAVAPSAGTPVRPHDSPVTDADTTEAVDQVIAHVSSYSPSLSYTLVHESDLDRELLTDLTLRLS